ncbi:unnamed protein product [Vicia faba]|uniref:Uncharacterized protein n=1 Tax=Vicia faba TaxID=3906 RepID=A0AAV0ZDQ3_VICFA|nr:unnamed protein product [Vicia faba]
MEMKFVVHIYVEHNGKGNAQEAGGQEDDVCGVEQDEIGNVSGVEQDGVGNVDGVEQVEICNVVVVEKVEGIDVVGVEQVEVRDENEDSEDNDFEAGGLSFDNSEDERAIGLDDCFDVIENEVEEKSKRGRIKVAAKKHKHNPKKVYGD